jgi:quinoprotein glucose dehydrogenase
LPERYQGHFFLCDFRGGSGNSGIRAFANKPRGAAFELTGEHEFAWSVLATDTDFGPDGALYLSDWVEGWAKPNKGRIYKVFDPARKNDPHVAQVKKLLAEGMAQRSLRELTKLLEHPDQRVRQEAQFALAERHAVAYRSLVRVARLGKNPLARLHALWGLGQIGRTAPEALEPVLELTTDRDAEVRAQAAKVLGDARMRAALDKLLPLLRNPETRVRFFAAIALGKLGRQEAFAPLVAMLRENADKDQYLRHAGVMGLVGVNDLALLRQASADNSAAVRMAALLALRRLHSPDVAAFLSDPVMRLRVEAARAVNDEPIDGALPRLAAVLGNSAALPEPLLYRALNAHFRLGQIGNALAVADFAAQAEAPEALRLEALSLLGDWAKPSGRDRIVGLWRPLPPRPAQIAADALRAKLDGILAGSDRVRQEFWRAGSTGCRSARYRSSCAWTSSTQRPAGGCRASRPSSRATTRPGRRTIRWPRSAKRWPEATPRRAGKFFCPNPRSPACAATRSTARAARSGRTCRRSALSRSGSTSSKHSSHRTGRSPRALRPWCWP